MMRFKIELSGLWCLTIFVLTIIFLSSCNHLEEKEQTIELEYIAWGCDCPNWVTHEDIKKYSQEPGQLVDFCIYVEPANDSIQLPDTMDFNDKKVVFTGRFYEKKGFPEGYSSAESSPKEGRVFHYTAYRIFEK